MQLSALTSALGHFVSELQRRKVLRFASAYIVGGWIILQVALALQTAMNLPASFSTVILSLLIIGLPVALVGSWFLEITPDGIKRTVSPGDGAPVKPQTSDLILAAMLALVVVVALVQAVMPRESVPTASPATAEAPKAEPPALGDKSIAVLPFANLSPDKQNEYFADGLTEELLNLLAKTGDLKVISRTSSFAFKGKDTPVPEIARQLGVRHILEGSVRTDGDELRVTAQLIDVSTDTHLWSETYERKMQSIFALQDEISRDIAGALKVEVTLARSAQDGPTKNLAAYRLYLEGLERRARGAISTPEDTDLFKKAIALDPKFAEAHAALAASFATRISVSPRSQYLELSKLARASAETAVALKPTLGFAHGVLGLLDRVARKWEPALINGEKAVGLSPSDSNVRLWLGGTQLALGYIERSAETLHELKRRDPLFDYATPMRMAVEFARGNDKIAEALAEDATEHGVGVSFRFAHYFLAGLSYDRGDAAAAAVHFRAFVPASFRDRPFVAAMVKAFGDPDAKHAAENAVRAEAAANPQFEPFGPLLLLKAYDATFAELDLAYPSPGGFSAQGFANLWNARHKSVRGDQRFKTFLVTLGLVDYWKKHGWPDKCRPQGADDFVCD